jgi:DNA-binding XRE family transcriptional regulator
MTPTVLDSEPQSSAKHHVADLLVPRWVRSSQEASKAAKSEDAKIVWIIKKAHFADCVAHKVAEDRSFKKTGYLVLLLDARSALLPPLAKRFRAVACVPNALPKDELDSVLRVADREDRFIGGIVDEDSNTLTLWRGNFHPVVVPFEAFPATGNGIRPQFNKFSVTDYGRTLRFGDYQSAADVVLFEYAPDFRRRLKQARFAQEQTLGASIRRLRKQRRLTLNDFGDVDPKTLARIEHGKVQRPRLETLKQIAKILRVSHDELASY